MLALDLPVDETETITGWFPAGLEPTVHVIDPDEIVLIVHGVPPIVTLVWPLTKFEPAITNDWPAVPDDGVIEEIDGVEDELYVNVNEPGNVIPRETTWIVAGDVFNPCAGTAHWTWPGVVWIIEHVLEPTVTWIVLGELENPLPLIVRTTPPYMLPDDGETLETVATDVRLGDDTTFPTPKNKAQYIFVFIIFK